MLSNTQLCSNFDQSNEVTESDEASQLTESELLELFQASEASVHVDRSKGLVGGDGDGAGPNYFDGFDPKRAVDRRRKPDERRTFEISKMWEVHNEIARRLLLGQKATHIADDLCVSPAMVSYVRNSRVVQDKLATMTAARDADAVDLAKEIREKAPVALKLLERIIEGEIDAPITTRAREANNWLDRAGFGAVRRVEGQFASVHFTADDIEAIKQRAIENGFARPSKLVNVTPALVNNG